LFRLLRHGESKLIVLKAVLPNGPCLQKQPFLCQLEEMYVLVEDREDSDEALADCDATTLMGEVDVVIFESPPIGDLPV